MKRIILAALFLFSQITLAGPPPVSVKGENSTALLPKWNLQFPNKQVSNLGGIDALINTGNLNEAVDPDLEDLTGGTSLFGLSVGTNVTGVGTTTAGQFTSGKRGGEITMTAASGFIAGQTATLASLPAAGTPMKVCADLLVDFPGLTFRITSNSVDEEVNVEASASFKRYCVSTTNYNTFVSLGVYAASSETDVFYIDNLYIGPADEVYENDAASYEFLSSDNYIKDPIAYKNYTDGATGTASFSRDITTNLLFGRSSWSCDSGSQNQYCEFALKTLEHPIITGSCAAYAWYKGDGSLYKLEILDGSNNVLNQSPVLTNASEWTLVEATYPCGASRQVRLTQTESGNGAAVSLGVYYGANRNIGTVAQATYFGGMTNAGASTCLYSESTSSGLSNFIALGTGSSCAAWTVDSTGSANGISAQGTNDHRMVWSNATIGDYKFTISGVYYPLASGSCIFRLSNGTDVSNEVQASSAISFFNQMVFNVKNTQTGTVTWKLEAADDQASGCTLKNYANYQVSWKVERYPSQAEQVLRMNTPPTNTDWAAYTPTTTGLGTVSGVDFIWRKNECNIEIQGKLTAGTTSAAAPSFSLPGSYTGITRTYAGNHVVGTAIINSANAGNYPTVIKSGATTFSITLSNTLNSGMNDLNASTFISSSAAISVDAKIPIANCTTPVVPMPLIKGGVTSAYSGVLKTNVAYITNSGTCAVGNAPGGWVTFNSDPGPGRCNLNVAAGTYNTIVGCSLTPYRSAGNTAAAAINVMSTSSIEFTTALNGGANSDMDAFLQCWGY